MPSTGWSNSRAVRRPSGPRPPRRETQPGPWSAGWVDAEWLPSGVSSFSGAVPRASGEKTVRRGRDRSNREGSLLRRGAFPILGGGKSKVRGATHRLASRADAELGEDRRHVVVDRL